MDETLNRLLEAESRAERLVEEALEEKERATRDTLQEAREAEARLDARVPEIHAAFVEKAKARADQSVSELERRYDERLRALREMSEAHELEAVDAALGIVLDPGAV